MGSTNKTDDEHLIQALTRLLRPLVRYLLSRGFTYIRLIQIIRPLYVALAEEQYSTNKQPLSDSRISVLTGLARRYVKELRNAPIPSDPSALKSSPSTKLVAEWVTNPKFLDRRRSPRQLDRLDNDSGRASFEELAKLATSDVRPRTLLDDLIERGMVEETSSGKLKLLSHAYKVDKHSNELIDYFGQHIHDHLAAATNNLNESSAPFLERSAFQDNLSPESLTSLHEYSEEQAMKLLKAVYAKAAELSEYDKGKSDNTHRFRIGAYCYFENEDRESGAD